MTKNSSLFEEKERSWWRAKYGSIEHSGSDDRKEGCRNIRVSAIYEVMSVPRFCTVVFGGLVIALTLLSYTELPFLAKDSSSTKLLLREEESALVSKGAANGMGTNMGSEMKMSTEANHVPSNDSKVLSKGANDIVSESIWKDNKMSILQGQYGDYICLCEDNTVDTGRTCRNTEAHLYDPNTLHIVKRQTNKCMCATKDGVDSCDCGPYLNQQWEYTSFQQLKTKENSSKCLTVTAYYKLSWENCDDDNMEQKFFFEGSCNDPSIYNIIATSSNVTYETKLGASDYCRGGPTDVTGRRDINKLSQTTELWKRSLDNDFKITLDTKKFSVKEGSNYGRAVIVTIKNLQPGSRYTLKVTEKKGMSYTFVTGCSCDPTGGDQSGSPLNVMPIQENGHVMFKFKDNSKCEDSFTFHRLKQVSRGVEENRVSFTRDYFYNGGTDCDSIVFPGIEASDNLLVSKLLIGTTYKYCIEASHMSHYMDDPNDVDGTLLSSDPLCVDHEVKWEASVKGLITTTPESRKYPVENVVIYWIMLDPETLNPLGTNKSSGQTITEKGGSFDIKLNLDDSIYHGNGKKEFPLKLIFEKTSYDISHTFLCNEGQDDCSGSEGIIMYLKHLDFKKEINIYDDTAIPFTGNVYVKNTQCSISNAAVCLHHHKRVGSQIMEEVLVCGETDHKGYYFLPVNIGSRVDAVNITYYSNKFEPHVDNVVDYTKGVLIEAGKNYINNDFVDITQTRLIVDVVGGLCNKLLGRSTINIKISGCDWKGLDKDQIVPRGIYNDVPAHQLEVEVKEIVGKDDMRIGHIWDSFQSPPIIRRIDLRNTEVADEKIGKADNTTTVNNEKGVKDREGMDEIEESEEMSSIEEQENLELVRFQYDGKLQMNVLLEPDHLSSTCKADFNPSNFEDANSLHVIPYMSIFNVRVNLAYEIIKDQLFCDIIDGTNLKLNILNNAGTDSNQGFGEFFKQLDSTTQELLKLCSSDSGGCMRDIIHDEDEKSGEPIGKARVEYSLATGRPQLLKPHVRYITFRVDGKDVHDIVHMAAIFIEGPYSKGPGNSFALPTHEPIMILRDPPGGKSYASYENVVTNVKVKSIDHSFTTSGSIAAGLKTEVEWDPKMCIGGGFGAIAIACKEIAAGDIEVNVLKTAPKVSNGFTYHKSNSAQYSTTWSYQTSEDPWTAGALSDVFVVPNLNLLYAEVKEVLWNNDTCNSVQPLPEKVIFDLKAPTTKQGLAFYSRYHLLNIKIPELKRNVKVLQDTIKNCCFEDKSKCQSNVMKEECSTDEQKKEKDANLKVLQDGLAGWNRTLEIDNLGLDSKTSIVDWFEAMSNTTGKSSALAPPSLIASAVELQNDILTQADQNEGIEMIKRIQFSGGGEMYAMQLSVEKTKETFLEREVLNLGHEVTLPGLDESKLTVFGIGVTVDLLATLSSENSITSTKEDSMSDSTTVSFVLGDDNVGDEFVLDLLLDERYGTVLFQTQAGISKCPHEKGTLAVEDPFIEILNRPSQFVPPNDEMVFEMKLGNIGYGQSTFTLYSQLTSDTSGLSLSVDGNGISGSGMAYDIGENESYLKTVTIKKGPEKFKDAAVDLVFESTCEADDTVEDPNYTKSKTVQLWNVNKDGNLFLEFLEPCPVVEWAGEMKRDHKFAITSESDDQNNLKVKVYNPSYSTKKLFNMISGRLEHVYLQYREVGEIHWKQARTQLQDGDKFSVVDLDFASEHAVENSYGYINMNWYVTNIPEGSYDIKVGAQCTLIEGLDQYNTFDAPILTGVIDLTRPEQYGKALPLKEDVMFGEEISVLFTEPIKCSRPFTFDVELVVDNIGLNEKPIGTSELQITCVGRKIGIQVPVWVEGVENILGSKFTIKIGNIKPESESNIFDINGNSMENNIIFGKTFSNVDLSQASTSFRLLQENSACAHVTSNILLRETKNKILSDLGWDQISHDEGIIDVKDMSCNNETDTFTSEIIISPYKRGEDNRLLRSVENESEEYPVHLYFKLVQLNNNRKDRKLTENNGYGIGSLFTYSKMKIIPCHSDLNRVVTDPKLVAGEEENLRHSISFMNNESSITLNSFTTSDFFQKQSVILKEMENNQEKMQKNYEEEMVSLHSELTFIMMVCVSISILVLFLVKW